MDTKHLTAERVPLPNLCDHITSSKT